jgi:aspartate/methionine/tyrosine aminotransferase
MTDYRSRRARAVSIQPQTSIDTRGRINLGSGTPDFEVPDFVVDPMVASLQARRLSYTPWAGLPELRQAVAAKMARQNGLEVDADREVLVTAGAQEALMTVLMTLLDPGDEVLITDPHYGVYTRAATIAGATMVPVATRPEDGFVPRVADVAAAITERTRAIVLVSPSNPTGAVFPRDVLQGLVDLAVERDLVVVSDEIYEDYVFDGLAHVTVAALPGARERTVSIYSLSKGFALTGIRVGYVVAPPDLIQAMLPFHHAMTICAPVTAQLGAAAALGRDRTWFAPILAEYDRRRGVWMEALDELGLPYARPRGAYYVFFDVRPTGLDAKTFVRRAGEEAGLTLGGGGGGAGEGWIRGSLMQRSPNLEEGLARLATFVRGL